MDGPEMNKGRKDKDEINGMEEWRTKAKRKDGRKIVVINKQRNGMDANESMEWKHLLHDIDRLIRLIRDLWLLHVVGDPLKVPWLSLPVEKPELIPIVDRNYCWRRTSMFARKNV